MLRSWGSPRSHSAAVEDATQVRLTVMQAVRVPLLLKKSTQYDSAIMTQA